jgi:hypothetical protein
MKELNFIVRNGDNLLLVNDHNCRACASADGQIGKRGDRKKHQNNALYHV